MRMTINEKVGKPCDTKCGNKINKKMHEWSEILVVKQLQPRTLNVTLSCETIQNI